MLNFAKDLAAALDALRRHAILFLLGITLIALAFLGRSWLDAHDATLRLQATLAAQQKTITDADQRQSTRDAQLTQTLTQIASAKQKVQTPAQAANALPQAVSQLIAAGPGGRTLPSPITIELPAASNAGSTPRANSRSAGILTANSSSQNANALKSDSVARVLEPGDSSTIPSAAANAANPSVASSVAPSAATRYPWTALKLELKKLGLAHASSASTKANPESNDLENQERTVTSKKGISTQQSLPSQSSGTNGTSAQNNSAPPPANIRVPQEDLKPLYDAVEDCQVCQAKLTAAQGDLLDEKTKFAAATAERDAAISAARGTFWKRTRTAAKWLIIGAAAGAVLSRYH